MTPASSQIPQLMREAIAAHQQGHLEVAESCYAQVLAAQPDHAEALRLSGIGARQRGDLVLAIERLTAACATASQDTDALCELGLSHLVAGDLFAAETALRDAVACDGKSHKALVNLGAVLQYRQHLSEAVQCYRSALSIEPDDVECHVNLVTALLDAECGEEALDECDQALAQHQRHPLLLAARGAVLNGLERVDEAAAALQEAVSANSDDDLALVNLAYAQNRSGDPHSAIGTLRQALAVNRDNSRAGADLINLLVAAGSQGQALELANDFLSRDPGDRQVLAALALARLDSGDEAGANELLDYEHLIRVVDSPSAPADFATLGDFNQALAEQVCCDSSLSLSPTTKATRGGGQTGELNLNGSTALIALQDFIRFAVGETAEQLRATGFGAHPAMAYGTARWSLRAWGTVLTAGGQQIPHMHPVGWLSGVYYVQLPDPAEQAHPQAGWLEFGCPPARWSLASKPLLHCVEPREGRLVLFPSYYFHRTRLFAGTDRRISVAFDVVPKPV